MATILVAEDSPLLLALIVEALAAAGHRALAASRGDKAGELLRRERVDLLITDSLMPGASGDELVAQLRLRRPHTPVIRLSGTDQPARMLPANEIFLQKPVALEQLLTAVDRLLRENG
jgi:DNA-binding response OmpR family regulator